MPLRLKFCVIYFEKLAFICNIDTHSRQSSNNPQFYIAITLWLSIFAYKLVFPKLLKGMKLRTLSNMISTSPLTLSYLLF
jgi:hypothetical protein